MNQKIVPVSARIYRLIAAFLVVGIMTGAISLFALSRLKVNGPVYQQIVLQKDLLADTLPPPLYLLESYTTALQMLGESDPVVVKEHIAKITTLHAEFEERRTDWNRQLAGTPIGNKLNEELREHAVPLLETIESEFIPAMKRRDTVLASSLAYGKLKLLYLEHRKSIDNLVKMAVENSQRDELAAREETSRHLGGMLQTPRLHRVYYQELRWGNYIGSPMHKLNQRFARMAVRVIEDGVSSGELAAHTNPITVRDLLFGGLEHIGQRTAFAGRPLDVVLEAQVLTRHLLEGITAAPPLPTSARTLAGAKAVTDNLDDLAALVNRLESAVTRLEDVDTQ